MNGVVLRVRLPDRVGAPYGLSFSFSMFTKIDLGLGDVKCTLAVVVVTEWILGLVMLAVFAITLANTVPLFDALFKSLF